MAQHIMDKCLTTELGINGLPNNYIYLKSEKNINIHLYINNRRNLINNILSYFNNYTDLKFETLSIDPKSYGAGYENNPNFCSQLENYKQKAIDLIKSFKGQIYYYISGHNGINHSSEFPNIDISKIKDIVKKEICGFTVIYFSLMCSNEQLKNTIISIRNDSRLLHNKFDITILDKKLCNHNVYFRSDTFSNIHLSGDIRNMLYTLHNSLSQYNNMVKHIDDKIYTPFVETVDDMNFMHNYFKSVIDLFKNQTFYYTSWIYHESEKPYIKKYIDVIGLDKTNEYITKVVKIFDITFITINPKLDNKVLIRSLIKSIKPDIDLRSELARKIDDEMQKENKLMREKIEILTAENTMLNKDVMQMRIKLAMLQIEIEDLKK